METGRFHTEQYPEEGSGMKLALALLIPLGCVLGFAHAQTFPAKPVRLIVPFVPGGGTDTFARIFGARLSTTWDQQMVVENRGGAQGNIGTAVGAKAPADGYTLTLAYVGTLAINPHLYRQTGFDALKDFAAIARATEEAWVVVVHPSVPVRTIKDLAALAKRYPGKLSFASSASGTQMVGELFKISTGTDILHVPYKGAGPAAIDLIAGNVDMMYSSVTGAVSYVRAGRLRALAVTGNHRVDSLPDVPHAVESGFPDLDVYGWFGLVAPAGTPRDVIVKLNTDFVRALNAPELREKLKSIGQTAAPSTVEEFQAQIRTDYERWGKVVRQSGVKAD